MELNLAKTVVSYLKAHPDEKFTVRQIAEWVFATYPEQCEAKKQSSQRLETNAELIQQIVREISSQLPRLQRKHLELKTTEGRPRKDKDYYSDRTDSAEVAAVESEGAASMMDASTLKIKVLIPARERDEIDWDMANRLTTENRDFLKYVKLVKQFYQTGEARPTDWDVPELDD